MANGGRLCISFCEPRVNCSRGRANGVKRASVRACRLIMATVGALARMEDMHGCVASRALGSTSPPLARMRERWQVSQQCMSYVSWWVGSARSRAWGTCRLVSRHVRGPSTALQKRLLGSCGLCLRNRYVGVTCAHSNDMMYTTLEGHSIQSDQMAAHPGRLPIAGANGRPETNHTHNNSPDRSTRRG